MSTAILTEPKGKRQKLFEAPAVYPTAEEAAAGLPNTKSDPRVQELVARTVKLSHDRAAVVRQIAEAEKNGGPVAASPLTAKANALASGRDPSDVADRGKALAELRDEAAALQLALEQLQSATAQLLVAVGAESAPAAYEAAKPLLRRQALAALELAAATVEVQRFRALIARKGLSAGGIPALSRTNAVFDPAFIPPGEPHLSHGARDLARRAAQLGLLTPAEADEQLARFARV